MVESLPLSFHFSCTPWEEAEKGNGALQIAVQFASSLDRGLLDEVFHLFDECSRYLFIDSITILRRLQEVTRHLCRNLSLFSPLPNRIEIFALVLRVEIHESFWCFRIPPNLTQDTGIWHTHQLLANDVHTVRDMETNDIVVILEGSFTLGFVVIIVEVQGLAEEVQAVKMVQTFDVCGKPTAIFRIDLDLVRF